jgi:energy-coupling factor transporter ATP-binding protein EcfA2
MERAEKTKILQELSEESLISNVLVPLFESLGFRDVRYSHPVLRFGSDIVYWSQDEFSNLIYTGVIIKGTKITHNDINNVVRQLAEAFDEPFTDLNDGKEKQITRVIVITTKGITGKAKNALMVPLRNLMLDRLVVVIDGNKLVDLIEEYLSLFFWNQYEYFNKYFHAMKSEFEIINDVSAIGQREPIQLEEIYVSLKVNEFREAIPHEEVYRESQMHEERQKEERIFDADDVVKKFDKVVIVGAPGSGKTTLLKHLALKFCRENLEKQERIVVPILIKLKEFLESGKNLRDYINEVFARFDFPEAKDFIEDDLKEGKCLILLDGFDELATVEKQMEITNRIEGLTQKYHKNRIIVTSRTAGYHGELKEFQELQIKEFDDQQIGKFIMNWFGSTDPAKAASMNKIIKENGRIRALARNPLMIAIIAIIYEEDRELPQRRVELYQRSVEVLLDKWDIKKRIKNKYDAKAKEKILRELALEAHCSEIKSFTKEKILEKFTEYLPEVHISTDKAEDVLKEIVERNALLKEVSIGLYEFLHLSFQEYLAALELREKRDYQTLLKHLYEPWWGEIVLLFAGFDRDATDLILKIEEKEKEDKQFKEDIFYSNLMLKGKCIADADYTDKKVREKIVDDLWHLYEYGEFFLLRKRAMNVLALIRPDSIIDSTTKKLRDEDRGVRERAAHALGNIGSEKAIDPLIRALGDEDSYVRERAAHALGNIGSEKAIDPLIRALGDEDSYVRERAAHALGNIGSEKAIDPLIRALGDEGEYLLWKVKDAAFESLEKICWKTRKRIITGISK